MEPHYKELCSVIEKRLTDGSSVFDVHVCNTVICCTDERGAWTIKAAIDQHAIGVEEE